MDLKMLMETDKYLFKCYVKGENLKREGDDVHTLGFKDGIAVVGYKPLKILDKTPLPMTKDNADNSRSINVSKLKTITVKTDPYTGKKFMLRDGRRIDIVCSQSSSLMQKLLPQDVIKQKAPLVGPPPLAALTNANTKGIIIKKAPIHAAAPTQNIVVKSLPFPSLNVNIAPKSAEKICLNTRNVNLSYHMSPSMKKPVICSMNRSDKALQTENALDLRDAYTQTETEFSSERESPVSDQFMQFILSDIDLQQTTRKMIDPRKPKTKEEVSKLSFFYDLRNALSFDRTGNL